MIWQNLQNNLSSIDSAPACPGNQVQDSGYFAHFIPECNNDGDYKSVQCDYRYGYCWCSDKNGNPAPGTTVRGHPDCKVPSRFQGYTVHSPICDPMIIFKIISFLPELISTLG